MAYLRGLDKGEKCQKQTNTSEAQLRNDMLYGGGRRGGNLSRADFIFFPPQIWVIMAFHFLHSLMPQCIAQTVLLKHIVRTQTFLS